MGALQIEDREDDRQHANTAALFEPSVRRGRKADPARDDVPAAVDAMRAHGAGGADAAAVGAVFGGMYGADAAKGPGAGVQADAKKPAALGLAGYEVVPDNHKGPLKPNQLRRSQYNELRRYEFDKLHVVDEAAAKDGKLANDQMTQAQFQQLAQAWLHISAGQGMQVTGSAADQKTFRKMLRDSLGDSPTMRQLVTDIGNDADPTHRIAASVGRGQRDTFVDHFDTGTIDLNDIEKFAQQPSADHKNEATRGEQLAHILGERRAAMTSADPGDFLPAHREGTRVHNAYRAERGQAAEKSAKTVVRDGKTFAVFRYADGSKHECELDANQDIAGMTRP